MHKIDILMAGMGVPTKAFNGQVNLVRAQPTVKGVIFWGMGRQLHMNPNGVRAVGGRKSTQWATEYWNIALILKMALIMHESMRFH